VHGNQPSVPSFSAFAVRRSPLIRPPFFSPPPQPSSPAQRAILLHRNSIPSHSLFGNSPALRRPADPVCHQVPRRDVSLGWVTASSNIPNQACLCRRSRPLPRCGRFHTESNGPPRSIHCYSSTRHRLTRRHCPYITVLPRLRACVRVPAAAPSVVLPSSSHTFACTSSGWLLKLIRAHPESNHLQRSSSFPFLHGDACRATMSSPFSFLATLPPPPAGLSLGEQLARTIAKRPWVDSLLACLPSSTHPAILSTSPSRPPLTHAQLRHAVANFRIPSSSPNASLGRNDRVAVVLPTGPEVWPYWVCG
jgi:hypothetical protein